MKEYGLDDIFDFGKHEGEQVEDLLEDDPQYLVWLWDEGVVDLDEAVLKKLEAKKLI